MGVESYLLPPRDDGEPQVVPASIELCVTGSDKLAERVPVAVVLGMSIDPAFRQQTEVKLVYDSSNQSTYFALHGTYFVNSTGRTVSTGSYWYSCYTRRQLTLCPSYRQLSWCYYSYFVELILAIPISQISSTTSLLFWTAVSLDLPSAHFKLKLIKTTVLQRLRSIASL